MDLLTFYILYIKQAIICWFHYEKKKLSMMEQYLFSDTGCMLLLSQRKMTWKRTRHKGHRAGNCGHLIGQDSRGAGRDTKQLNSYTTVLNLPVSK